MNGRSLYDRVTEAKAACPVGQYDSYRGNKNIDTSDEAGPMAAWDFLPHQERRMWNRVASELVTRRGASRAK